jgi:hypothetical protein
MNRKPNQSGIVPDEVQTIRIIQSLGFEYHGGSGPSTHVAYVRHREADGIDTFDSITSGAYSIGGQAGTLQAKHANYFVE